MDEFDRMTRIDAIILRDETLELIGMGPYPSGGLHQAILEWATKDNDHLWTFHMLIEESLIELIDGRLDYTPLMGERISAVLGEPT